MSEDYTLISRSGRSGVYRLDAGLYAVLLSGVDNVRRDVIASSETVAAVADALVGDGVLYQVGEIPVIRLGSNKTRILHTRQHEAAFIHRHLMVGVCHEEVLPDRLQVPTALDNEEDPFEIWRGLCGANNASKVDWHSGGVSLSPAFRSSNVPQFRGELAHPIVGELPPGWFAAPPGEAGSYNELRKLFSSLPLDPAGHAVLYTYLLGAFHTDSLITPAPLLCVDSREQAVGKTEAVMAISHLIDDDAASLSPPYSRDTEVLTSHFMKNKRLAALDNLSAVKDYQHPWLASILSDRTAADRPKYGRTTVEFPGRLVAITFILGLATLHRDLLSRSWRVELHGGGKPLSHRPNRFARENRRLLQAQCYHAVTEAPEWRCPSSGTRANEYEAKGAAAYSWLFNLKQETTHARLKEAQRRVSAYSTAFLKLLKQERVEFPDPDAVLPVQSGRPTAAQITYLSGATGLGYKAVRKENEILLEKYEPEVIQK